MRSGVVVQARLGSSRLPGKVLMRLGDRSVLDHVLERCQAIAGIDVVCCAVPAGVADDPVADAARCLGATVVRGPEADVLERYRLAADSLGLDVVMRVTSDCPLIDPDVCAAVLSLRSATGADYTCNNAPPSWPHGLDCEVMTRSALSRAARLAERPWQREHVTPWLRTHPGLARANLAMSPSLAGAAVEQRWTLDTPKDLAFLCALFQRLPVGSAGWGWRVAYRITAADPALCGINAGEDRLQGLKKSMEEAA
jgi:spore coat polysaccharide biosynthesis protein SpsF